MPRLREHVVRLARRTLFHQRVQMAVKAAVSATLAWVVAGLVDTGDLEDYQYYAPLGAVVAVYPTVAGSMRSSLEAVAAIAAGGAVGVGVHALTDPGLLGLALAVGLGVAVAGLPLFGSERGIVPIASLFVLVIGRSDPVGYTLAYVGLALLGGLVAVGVGLAFPAMRLTQGRDAVRSVQASLADQLDDLAEGLRADVPPDAAEWQSRQWDVQPALRRMQAAFLEIQEASRVNARARFHRTEVERQRQVVLALQRVGLLVEDLAVTVAETHRADVPSPVDHELAALLADAVQALASLVRTYDQPLPPDDERVAHAEAATRRLTEAFAARRELDAVDLAVLGSVVANLRRSVATVLPQRDDEQRAAAAG